MKCRLRLVSSLSVQEVVERILAADKHQVPFTKVSRHGDRFIAVTKLGPLRFEDRMRIANVEKSGESMRGMILKEGPWLVGTIRFAAISSPEGTVLGWEYDLRLPWLILNLPLAFTMNLGYRIGLSRLLR